MSAEQEAIEFWRREAVDLHKRTIGALFNVFRELSGANPHTAYLGFTPVSQASAWHCVAEMNVDEGIRAADTMQRRVAGECPRADL